MGDHFCCVVARNGCSMFLVTVALIIAHSSTTFVLLQIPSLCAEVTTLATSQFGFVYLALFLSLHFASALLRGVCVFTRPLIFIIVGLLLLALSTASLTLVDSLYALCAALSVHGMAMSFVTNAATEMMEQTLRRSERTKFRKPTLLILSVSSKLGFIIGALVG